MPAAKFQMDDLRMHLAMPAEAGPFVHMCPDTTDKESPDG
jgi:hypothetical protein